MVQQYVHTNWQHHLSRAIGPQQATNCIAAMHFCRGAEGVSGRVQFAPVVLPVALLTCMHAGAAALTIVINFSWHQLYLHGQE